MKKLFITLLMCFLFLNFSVCVSAEGKRYYRRATDDAGNEYRIGPYWSYWAARDAYFNFSVSNYVEESGDESDDECGSDRNSNSSACSVL